MSNVLNRTTFELVTSANTPDYPVEDWLKNPDFSTVSGVPVKYLKIVDDSILEMNQSEKNVVNAANLQDYKHEKQMAIDIRTQELIAEGFTYSGLVFSLSLNSQSYWNGLGNLAANNLLVEPDHFPLQINTLNDESSYNLVNIQDTITIFAVASATVRARLESGTVLKTQIRNATTYDEVYAVVDTR